jgi:hypothetical protein
MYMTPDVLHAKVERIIIRIAGACSCRNKRRIKARKVQQSGQKKNKLHSSQGK